jgi:pimeloyl-ACP methyl ester carboxylesterase
MTKTTHLTVRGLIWLTLCPVLACNEDDGTSTIDQSPAIGTAGTSGATAGNSGNTSAACPVMVNDADCDKTRRPIVFVHGTVANGESFAHPALLLASNGYCPDRIRAVEYHSLIAAPCADGAATCAFSLDREATYAGAKLAIDQAIAKLLAETGADKVDLLGHSQGSGHGSRYTGENPDKVAHYVHLAGGQLEVDPGGVPTLCLSSTGDRPVTCKTTQNFTFQDETLDHAAVSSSTESFVEIFKFLNDGKVPQYDTVQCGDPITLEGRAPTFGDNTFLPGSKVEVYELETTGNPTMRGAPTKSFEIGADGNFGPWEAHRGATYEFKLVPPPGDSRRPRHIYMQPFTRSDRLLRFNFETKDSTASATSKQVNYADSHAVFVARRRQKAFLFGRDTLTVDGFAAINELNAAARTVTCALYLYDKSLTELPGPGDGVSMGGSIIKGTFVNSADVFMPSSPPAFMKVVFNGVTTLVPNWSSGSGGMSLVLLD